MENKKNIWNIPNILSLSRIFFSFLLILIFLLGSDLFNVIKTDFKISDNFHLPLTYLLCFLIFLIASLTDWFDGYIARKYNMVTVFGKFIDSIADKILTNSALFLLAFSKIIPIWIALILLIRDLIIDTMKGILGSKGIIVGANYLGKIRAFALMGILTIYFIFNINTLSHNGCLLNTIPYSLFSQLLLVPIYLVTILSIISAIVYLKHYWKDLVNNDNK
ncbi:MAG: CDP-diacylglycerol--glycerol-3-phosphate 3-phosphatidyltransferase [Mycoplasmataceae bacterium]|nr:CDP-diacylglycerol--glycerol-3-phosphate 3-phosphatidyltransferase [Mycoplasmataceae bacterium]